MVREIEAFTDDETGEVSVKAKYSRNGEYPSQLVITDTRDRPHVLSSWKHIPQEIDSYQLYMDYQDSGILVVTDIGITSGGETYKIQLEESGFFTNTADEFIDEEIESMISEFYGGPVNVYDWHYYIRVMHSLKQSSVSSVKSKLSVLERFGKAFHRAVSLFRN